MLLIIFYHYAIILSLTGNHRVTIDELAEEVDPSSSTVARATSIPVVRYNHISHTVYIHIYVPGFHLEKLARGGSRGHYHN